MNLSPRIASPQSFARSTRAAARALSRAPALIVSGSLFGTSLFACYGDNGTDPSAIDLLPPAHGVQLQTPAFEVPAGAEVQRCYWFKLPSDVDIEVTRIQIHYLTGSHHMNLFQTNKNVDDRVEDCFSPLPFSGPGNSDGLDLIVGSQTTDLDWNLPEGIAIRLKAKRQLVLQTHYVNATTQAAPLGVGRVKINLSAEPDASKIRAHMGMMFANNVNIRIPPHEAREFTTSCGVSHPIQIAALTGHFHSRGKEFSVNLQPDPEHTSEEIYRSRAWAEPPFTVLAEPKELPANGALSYTCSYVNRTDQELTFGPRVETQEHCNLFAYFYPWEEAHTRYCF